MSAARKFTFDLDLAVKPARNRVMPEDEFEAMIAAARREGYEDGMRQGRDSTEARSAQSLAQAAQTLAEEAARMAENFDIHQKKTLADAVDLATSIARKLAAHLIAREPRAELEALIADCLSTLEHAPHLLVRCHPDLCDAMRQAAEARIRISGFEGRLVVLGDPEIGLGDGRIEWADGGLVRDVNTISQTINTRIAAYLAARGPGHED